MSVVSKKVEDLKVGDWVDVTSCDYLKNHVSFGLFAKVGFISIEQTSPPCVIVSYESIDHVGYNVGRELRVAVA